jgi:hypothetical protein
MQTIRKSISTAVIGIMTAIAVTGTAGSGAAALSHSVAVAFEPCPLPLPMEAHGGATLWADGRQRDRTDAGSGLVLPARVHVPPTSDTGFGCPIARTIS